VDSDASEPAHPARDETTRRALRSVPPSGDAATSLVSLLASPRSDAYDRFRATVDRRRLSILFAVGLPVYASFGVLDALAYPEARETLWLLRGIALALVLPILYALQARFDIRVGRLATQLGMFVAAGMIAVMTAALDGFPSHYAIGILLVFITSVAMEVGPPRAQLAIMGSVLLLYVVLNVTLHPHSFERDSSAGLQHLFYLGGGFVLCMAASGVLEHQRRLLFNHQRALELQNQALERARAHQREFLRTVSHEMRTPLNSILGFAELLEKEPLGDKGARRLERIAQSAKRQLRLVDDLLDLARIEAGHLVLHPAEVELGALLEDVAEETRPLLGGRDVVLRVEFERSRETASEASFRKARNPEKDRCEAPTILADELRLRQIVLNLAANATKFTHEGEIVLSAEIEGDGVRIAVRDTGVGIAPEEQDRIFAAFEQTAAGAAAGGTGLGLGIAARLVTLMGGELSLESAPGEGSTFAVWLPGGGPRQPREGESGRRSPPSRSAPSGRSVPVATGRLSTGGRDE